MQQKQAVQILEDNPKPQISGLYTLADKDYLNDIEDIIKAIDNKPVRGNVFRLYTRILKVFRLSATISLKVLSWLSKLGSSEIDVRAIEASHNYHLGLRIKGMGH